jgi:hypothetical protein
MQACRKLTVLDRANLLLASDIAKHQELKEITDERLGGGGPRRTMAQIEGAGTRQRVVANHAARVQPRTGRIHRLVRAGAAAYEQVA